MHGVEVVSGNGPNERDTVRWAMRFLTKPPISHGKSAIRLFDEMNAKRNADRLIIAV